MAMFNLIKLIYMYIYPIIFFELSSKVRLDYNLQNKFFKFAIHLTNVNLTTHILTVLYFFQEKMYMYNFET